MIAHLAYAVWTASLPSPANLHPPTTCHIF
jgi:hypothetical protein